MGDERPLVDYEVFVDVESGDGCLDYDYRNFVSKWFFISNVEQVEWNYGGNRNYGEIHG